MKLLNLDATRAAMAPFETVEQLNANTIAIRDQYAEIMTTTEKAVLDVLHRFASKHFGVSYLSKTSIAEKVGVSRRQVIRICNKFEAQGIIVQYATDRKAGGGQTSNTIVFLTQVTARAAFVNESEQVADNMQEVIEIISVGTGDVTANDTRLDALKDAPGELKDLKITRDTEACAALNKQGLVKKLPETLRYLFAPFFDTDTIYELSGVVFKAKASVDKDVKIEDHAATYYDVILKAINGFNRGQVKSLPAVLYRAIERTTREIVNATRQELLRSQFGI